MNEKPFSMRAFISLLLTFCFAALALSGLLLYAAPQCRVAAAIGWSVFGLEKESWAAIHMVTAAAFLVLASIHLGVFNLRPLLAYIKGRQRKPRCRALHTELIAAALITVVLIVGAAWLVPPFKWLSDGRSAIEQQYRDSSAFDQRGQGQGRGPGHRRMPAPLP